MILPSELHPPTTETVGYFKYDTPKFAMWLADVHGHDWRVREASASSLSPLLELIRPRAPLSRFLVMPVAGWTVLLNDGPNGTDVGLLPMHATRDLGCCSVRAVAVPTGTERFPATILEVFEPSAAMDPFLCRRTLFAADDGGQWRFGQYGNPFPFEDTVVYKRRVIRKRFTPEMLELFLERLGVPVNSAPDTNSALFVEDSRASS